MRGPTLLVEGCSLGERRELLNGIVGPLLMIRIPQSPDAAAQRAEIGRPTRAEVWRTLLEVNCQRATRNGVRVIISR